MPESDVRTDSKDIMPASDSRLPTYRPGRGKGAFSPLLHPVRIPSANRLLEAYVLLMIRNRQQIYEIFWSAMLTYVREFIEETGLIEHEQLEPWCWNVYRTSCVMGKYIGDMLDQLKQDKSLICQA